MPTDVLGARVPVVYTVEDIQPTATEALVTTGVLNRGGSVTTGLTGFTVSAGKTLRVSAIHATGRLVGTTVSVSSLRLRALAGGAAAVGSPMLASWRMANPSVGTQAANYGIEPIILPFGEGLEFAAGAGLNFTVLSSTAAMHALTLTLIGFEYS